MGYGGRLGLTKSELLRADSDGRELVHEVIRNSTLDEITEEVQSSVAYAPNDPR